MVQDCIHIVVKSQTCANSQMSDLYNELSMQQWLRDHGTDKWNVELEFEMVYNRMIMHELIYYMLSGILRMLSQIVIELPKYYFYNV